MKTKTKRVAPSEAESVTFSALELEVLNTFCDTGNLDELASSLYINHAETLNILRSGLHKLKTNPILLEQWLDDPYIQVIKILHPLQKASFLEAHLSKHNLPTFLYNNLLRMHCCTMKDVLEYSLSQLRTQRGMGKRSIAVLISILKENNCFHLLKP